MTKITSRHRHWLVFLVSLTVLSIAYQARAEPNNKEPIRLSDICGEHLQALWSNPIYPTIKKKRMITMNVIPWEGNYAVDSVIWDEGGRGLGVPNDVDTKLLTRDGKTIWWQRYTDCTYVFGNSHVVSVGKGLYRWHNALRGTGADENLLYHIWIDEKGVVEWIHAQRFDSLYHDIQVKVYGEVAYYLASRCKDGFCQIESMRISKEGIDPGGWRTILRWPYPADSGSGTLCNPLDATIARFWISRRDPRKPGVKEFRLIQFSSEENGKVISESQLFFPEKAEVAFAQSENGFVFFQVEGKRGTFIRVDKEGKEIQRQGNDILEGFTTWFSSMKLFKDGWLVRGRNEAGSDILVRLSGEGRPMWSHLLKDDVQFAGIDRDYLFLSRQGDLFMCTEKEK